MVADADHSASVLTVTSILHALRDMGVAVEESSAYAKVSGLDDSKRVGADVTDELWKFAESVTGNPHIGLAVGAQMAPGALGAVDYLLRSAETPRESIRFAMRYSSLLDTRALITADESEEKLALRFSRAAGSRWNRHDIECLFRVTHSVLASRIAEDGAIEVRFAHKEVAPAEVYAEAFSCRPTFNCAYHELCLSQRVLDRPYEEADPGLTKILEEHVESKLRELPNRELRSEVLRCVSELLPEGKASLDNVASRLGLSTRTLRRRLKELDAPFRDLLDEYRRESAKTQLLNSDRSIKEIASALDFSDASTFQRAFRRWFGMSPGEFRAENSERSA